MSTSNPKSSSSASRPRATKRNPSKTPFRPSARKSAIPQTKNASRRTLGSKQASKPSTRQGSSLRNNATSSTTLKSKAKSQASSKLKSQPSSKTSGSSATLPRKIFVGVVGVAIFALLALCVLLVLSHMPVFVINGIDASATEHVSAEQIAKLANIEEGTTLLSVDEQLVADNIKQNPWIKEVVLKREFPSTLGIECQERQVGAIVLIGAGASVWSIGTDGVWIEPVTLDTSSQDLSAAALARAQELGCLLISDVPSTVDPAQGSSTTDSTINAVLTFQDELSKDITNQARVYYAASEGSTSVVLDSGLEISLGTPEDINAKSQAITEIMATYPNQLTYINVRVASKPTYRKVPDGTTIASVNDVVAANAPETSNEGNTSGDGADGGSGDDEDSSSDTSDEAASADSSNEE